MPKHKGKKTLVLNLDETLVHSVFYEDEKADFMFSFKMFEKIYSLSCYKRPYLDEFLAEMAKSFEIVYYTQAVEDYANSVINRIDPKKLASGRLFRDAWIMKEDYYIKDIDKLGRL